MYSLVNKVGDLLDEVYTMLSMTGDLVILVLREEETGEHITTTSKGRVLFRNYYLREQKAKQRVKQKVNFERVGKFWYIILDLSEILFEQNWDHFRGKLYPAPSIPNG